MKYQVKGGARDCRCGGVGCYFCQRRGFLLICPHCGDIDSQEQDQDGFVCQACGTHYTKTGEIIEDLEEDNNNT